MLATGGALRVRAVDQLPWRCGKSLLTGVLSAFVPAL